MITACLILVGVWIFSLAVFVWLAFRAGPLDEEAEQIHRLAEIGLRAREGNGVEILGYPPEDEQ